GPMCAPGGMDMSDGIITLRGGISNISERRVRQQLPANKKEELCDGVRIGVYINVCGVRSPAFFFFLWDGQRYITTQQFVGNVLTKEAREGIVRFFPGSER